MLVLSIQKHKQFIRNVEKTFFLIYEIYFKICNVIDNVESRTEPIQIDIVS